MITTKKELDEVDKKILKLAGEGLTAKETGYELNISKKSIEKRFHIMMKYYNCNSKTELVTKLKNEL